MDISPYSKDINPNGSYNINRYNSIGRKINSYLLLSCA